MSRHPLASVVLVLILSSPVSAEQSPRSGGYDERVQIVAYNPMNVVRVIGSPTNSTQIIFGAGEEITHVAVGDADAWLAQPAGNLLFIKPTEIRLSTNMQVVTKRIDGSNRSYQFRLVATRRGNDGGSAAIFAVSFTYPEDVRAGRAAMNARAAALAREQAAQSRLSQAWAEGPRNWRYVAQGSVMLEPTEVSDNGRQTAFRFPGNMRVPTIYTAAPDGTETIVPYTMVHDIAVVQTTAREFTLRDGQEVLRIINQGFDPVGRNPGTGTGTPDLTRIVRGVGL
ncbi:P-type conjugative transfer protein VirB9 [Agrobacterium rosae]|uniref:Type IV secretion system protein virB9 n=1 Tax=Agrobacterium rosae TaxID=1972867 RepID=A0A1R3U7S5_9HYPH|nr:P-type conjugative transfer protein VirB9 [Agrobacterium rosae]SCX35822.1 Type IV secretion system protein virB9 precursor [Agrobacterium rosae]